MSITDELREWMLHHEPASLDGLNRIADRIDERHEQTFRNLTDALQKQEDATRELDKKSVLLPKDADGEPIHIGDVMEWINDKNVIRTVSGVGSDVFFAWSKDTDRYTQNDAKAYRHRRKPTVEDVLREFAKCWDDPAHYAKGELVEAYAEKLRLADGGEEQ